MNRIKQTGFTLVEIAIVLVIIGLLLGGILKGQELINSARVRNMADQSSAIQAAYYGFIDRYRQVPGDWDNTNAGEAIGTTVNSGGNENGRIDRDNWTEAAGVWEQLSKAGFITGDYQGGTDSNSYFNNAPTNAFNGRVALSRFQGGGTDYQGTGSERLGFLFGLQTPVNVMRELDVKLDDGTPTSGVLRATASNAGALSDITAQPSGASTCVDTSGTQAIWDVSTNSQDCNGINLY